MAKKRGRLKKWKKKILGLSLGLGLFVMSLPSWNSYAAEETGEEAFTLNSSGGETTETEIVDPFDAKKNFTTVLYDNTSGLPTSEANAIAQTSEGFIWIGSYSGLIRYDGQDFERQSASTGIASVKCLFVDKKDRLWVGTNDRGVALMEKGEIRMWGKEEGLRSGAIQALLEDENGLIYVATSQGIGIIGKNMELSMIEDPRIETAFLYELRIGNDGLIYGLTNTGDLVTLKDGKVVTYLSVEDNWLKNISCVFPDPEMAGAVYVEAEDSKVYRGKIESDGFEVIEMINIDPLSTVQKFEYIDGKIWVCTRTGIGAIDQDGFHELEGIPMNRSCGVMADYEGNLWFVSSRQGVMKIVPNRFIDVSAQYDLPEDVVNSTCMYNGRLYIGTDSGLKVVDRNGIVYSIPVSKAVTSSGKALGYNDMIRMLQDIRIRSIIRDSHGCMWISTWRDYGLLRYDQGVLTMFPISAGLLSDHIRAISEREDGSILVAHTGGVVEIQGNEITRVYSEDDGIANTEILTVAEGENRDVLMGTDGGGIYIVGDSGTRHIGTEDGLTSDTVMRIKKSRSADVYWVITGTSIAYLTTDDYKVVTISHFPYTNNFDIYENSKGEAWILSSNGVYLLPVQDLIDNQEMNPTHYGMADGLPDIATANSYSELTSDGDLYIAGSSRVVKVNIEETVDDLNDLKLGVPYVEVDGTMIYPDENGDFEIPSKMRKLTIFPFVFNYSLVNPQVSFRLEGLDTETMSLPRNEIGPLDYTNLAGGEYDFVMELLDNSGRVSESKVVVRIMKEKTLFEQVWFYVLVGILFLGLAFLAVRAYVRQTVHQLEARHKEEAEKQRLNSELSTAYQIQVGMLPHVFPPFPDHKEFEIYASMDPAKEVGGDFYDYYLIDEDHLALVIADVSGKGVPAALFMMASKIIVQSCAMLGRSAGEILTKTNEAVCSNNPYDMFITVWIGILEISTGKMKCANAGHEFPALMKDGQFTLFKDRHGLVIGAMEGMKYREYELQLEPGDKIFVYTDGVAEATDAEGWMFGTDRMIEALNQEPEAAPETILKGMRKAVDGFVKNAEQFDDMTMLCLEYNGPEKQNEEM